MEGKKTSIAEEYYNHYENNQYYNVFMHFLFIELSGKKFTCLKEFTIKDIISNMQLNINQLVNYIYKINEITHKDVYKCLSCIFGAFLGDAIGAYCEFHQPNTRNINKIFVGNPMFGDAPGQVTDDSEMAISSAFAIMDNPEINNLNSDYLYYYYGLWHLSAPKDEGNTTRKALKDFDPHIFNPEKENNYIKNFEKIFSKNSNSLANGFLMRTSPLIVWCYYRFYEKIINTFKKQNNTFELFELFTIIQKQAMKDNICTHPNFTLSVAHSIFIIMSLGAICELKPHEILDNTIRLLNNDYFKTLECKYITDMIFEELAIYNKNKGLSDFKNCFYYFTYGTKNVNDHMGHYFHAFRLTLYYLYFFDEIKVPYNVTKYREIMNQICSFGGDTDTNCAIVGTVIGPLVGFKNFGEREFLTMVRLVPKKRCVYSSGLMILYVHYLKMNKNNQEKKKIFLNMILKMMLEKIDINNLDKVFSVNKFKNDINFNAINYTNTEKYNLEKGYQYYKKK